MNTPCLRIPARPNLVCLLPPLARQLHTHECTRTRSSGGTTRPPPPATSPCFSRTPTVLKCNCLCPRPASPPPPSTVHPMHTRHTRLTRVPRALLLPACCRAPAAAAPWLHNKIAARPGPGSQHGLSRTADSTYKQAPVNLQAVRAWPTCTGANTTLRGARCRQHD